MPEKGKDKSEGKKRLIPTGKLKDISKRISDYGAKASKTARGELEKAATTTRETVAKRPSIDKEGRDTIKKAGREALSRVGQEYAVRVGDDYAEIFDKNPIVLGVLEKEEIVSENPVLLDTFYNVRWRSSLTLAGLAAAAVHGRETITDFTKVFHDIGHEKLSKILLGDPMEGIHSDIIDASRGTYHRVSEGHDIVGLIDCYNEEGIKGALAWFQHMGQDFTTDTGVPFAFDAKLMQDLLPIDRPAQATMLLSLNAAGMLAGILAVVAIVRLWQSGGQILENMRVKGYCQEAMRYHEQEDYPGAIGMFKEALDISPGNPRLLLPLGFVYMEQSKNRFNAHRAFEEVGRALAKRDEELDFGGAAISMRGLSYTLALSTSDVVVSDGYNKDHWKEYLRELVISGASSFNKTAREQSERRIIRHIPGGPLLPARHMSAATNYYLGAKILASCPIIAGQDDEVVRYLDKACAQLECVKDIETTLCDKIDFLSGFWRAELTPVRG